MWRISDMWRILDFLLYKQLKQNTSLLMFDLNINLDLGIQYFNNQNKMLSQTFNSKPRQDLKTLHKSHMNNNVSIFNITSLVFTNYNCNISSSPSCHRGILLFSTWRENLPPWKYKLYHLDSFSHKEAKLIEI